MPVRKRGKGDRRPPERTQLITALFDINKFANLIDFHGGISKFGQIHKDGLAWTKEHQGRDVIRELILMPRGHLKTTVFTVLDILHSIYINPNVRIYVGSANQNLSKAILREITANLVDPWLQDNVWNNRPHFSGRLIPLMDKGAVQRRMVKLEETGEFSDFEEDALDPQDDKKKIWRQDAIQVLRPYKLKEPTVVIGSVDSPATGFHYDKLYFDDIINFDNYDKPEKVERLDIWRNDMFSVLDDAYIDTDLEQALYEAKEMHRYIPNEVCKKNSVVGGFVRVVGTRYFKHDWYKQILDNNDIQEEEDRWDTWVHNIYKNGENPNDGYIWHEKWTSKNEAVKRKEMTKKHFYAQYLNKVIVDEDQILPMDRIKGIFAGGVSFTKQGSSRVKIITDQNTQRSVEVNLHFCIDPAATCTPDADFTAFAIGGKDSEGSLYVVDFALMKLTSDNWIKKMYDYLIKWNLRAVHLETVAFAVELKNTIRNKFGEYFPISIRDYKPSTKTSKKERIETGLEPLINNGMLLLCNHAFQNIEACDQFNFFPSETVKDDLPDVIQQLNEVSKKTLKVTNKVTNISDYANSRWGGFY